MKHAKRVMVLTVLSVALASQTLDMRGTWAPLTGQASAAASSTTDVDLKAEIREVNHSIEAFRNAMVQAKPDIIMAYSMPDLSFGHSNGVVQSREEFAEVVRSKSEDFKRVELTNKRLKVIGDTAIERHHFSADIIYEGQLMNFELEVVEVWKKVDNYWRLFVRQAFKT